MLCITKCQCFKDRFSEIDDWNPIIAKLIVSCLIILFYELRMPKFETRIPQQLPPLIEIYKSIKSLFRSPFSEL